MKVDGSGDPAPQYDVDDCEFYYDPSGDGVFWAQEMAAFDADGDNKLSFAEWSGLYDAGSFCVCENSEAMFARFDEDGDESISLAEFKNVWIHFTGSTCYELIAAFGQAPDEKAEICAFYGLDYSLEESGANALLTAVFAALTAAMLII